jgi:hypothetical protein
MKWILEIKTTTGGFCDKSSCNWYDMHGGGISPNACCQLFGSFIAKDGRQCSACVAVCPPVSREEIL